MDIHELRMANQLTALPSGRLNIDIDKGNDRLVTKHDNQGVNTPGAHFTNNFSITIQMWWKFHFALIQALIKWSLQNLAHGTTAGLSWHVQNFVSIWSTVIELELNEFSIEFELWWKNR